MKNEHAAAPESKDSNTHAPLSQAEIDKIIWEIKRKSEKEFQERLENMSPEEEEEALSWARYMS